ncbi:hypothetical protein Pan258_31190 [Symmachiella dynata]|uniref:Uncharacterized protein n=2 Tax=Symmachiella dynata TaxID=2527995 RepID=A0A517ZQG8_9PLAN|nr:hypothetical protein Pan258_31190 [Symmachiella dynata]QDU44739.1 hypothetical protein Mal52_32250 [Symmachiella dynata]
MQLEDFTIPSKVHVNWNTDMNKGIQHITPSGITNRVRRTPTNSALPDGEVITIVTNGANDEIAAQAALRLGQEGIPAKVVHGRYVTNSESHRLDETADGVSAFLILDPDYEGTATAASLPDISNKSKSTRTANKLRLDPAPADSLPPHRSTQSRVDRIVQTVRSFKQKDLPRQRVTPDAYNRFDSSGSGRDPISKEFRKRPEIGEQFELSEDLLQRELELVKAARLSEEVEAFFDVYSQVGARTRFLWQWCVHGAELTTISNVAPQWRRHVCDTKVLSIMLCVLLDDVADEQGNEPLLEALMKIIEGQPAPAMQNFSAKDRKTAEVTQYLSQIYESRISEYPLHDVYKRLLEFDLMQYFNTMRYSCLLNENLSLLNVTEHELYLPHAMHMMSFSTLDLMCTPEFDVHELGRFREAIWHAQCMGRVGNLLSTWEREIEQTDFTSGVFARAVIKGDLNVDQLNASDAPAIEAAILGGGHEQYFLNRWHEHRECLKTKLAEIHSVDLHGFVEAQERFFRMHLACRGAI